MAIADALRSRPPRRSVRAPATQPTPPVGWRLEAGPAGGWAWSLAWRARPDDDGGHVDAVPGQLRYDLLRRLWLAGIDPADSDAVLVVAVRLLASKGIVVDGIEELQVRPVRRLAPVRRPATLRRPACPTCRARLIWPGAFAPDGLWADRWCRHAGPAP